jgi:hypothetical protein
MLKIHLKSKKIERDIHITLLLFKSSQILIHSKLYVNPSKIFFSNQNPPLFTGNLHFTTLEEMNAEISILKNVPWSPATLNGTYWRSCDGNLPTESLLGFLNK